MRILLISLSILMALSACGKAQNSSTNLTANSKSENKQDSMSKEVSESQYKVGQVWSYKTRSNETNSTFIIVKIESYPKIGNIIHIALRDLKIRNPHSPDGIANKMNHLPFSEEAVSKSSVKLLKENAELPDFEEGYKLWKEAFDEKQAGYYTITIAEAVNIAEKSLNQ